MIINLITGVDGSGKSTLFEKLQKLNFSTVRVLLIPQINEKEISDKKLKEIAHLINLLGNDEHTSKKPHFKALNLFASMMLFSDLCNAYKNENCSLLFCERHPLIDAPIYSKFYGPLTNPDTILRSDLDYLNINYSKIFEFIIKKIPKNYLIEKKSLAEQILDFIYTYFSDKSVNTDNFYENLFNTNYPNKIYFLEGTATIFYERILQRKYTEAHEKIEILNLFIKAYNDLFSNLKKSTVVRIHADDFNSLDIFFSKLVNEICCSLSLNLDTFPNVPGRGLLTAQSTLMRQDFLQNINNPINKIAKTSFLLPEIKNKIESFIGAVEIPVGLIGPLLFIENNESEMVYCAGATLEGALIASMNRGAKAISLSGGFQAHFVHQKMIRSPMFLFENLNETVQFQKWIKEHFSAIKIISANYSNHAKLIEIIPLIISRSVHLNFVFETGDASGQNMTTICTWHAMLWIVENFESESKLKIKDYVIEGNASSDKKVSNYSIQNGRGIHVIAECYLSETIIQQVLRTSSEALFNNYLPSVSATRFYGMLGYNINVANAIAAVFAATGQDLACIHESSNAFLSIEKVEKGLYFSLTLPSLVIATVGGGTNLPKQQEVLALMKCNGKNSIQRFAKLIAGFALGLEISTFSAIVSGAFAKSHEKLGRNKPLNWMTRSEITSDFLKNILINIDLNDSIKINLNDKTIENGIITTLAGTINNKLIGFFTLLIEYANEIENKKIVLKSKPTDLDVIKGLHHLAAHIDPKLSDLIKIHQVYLEYHLCHIKESLLYNALSTLQIDCIPKYYGSFEDRERETYYIFQEFLEEEKMLLFNSENKPELWTPNFIKKTIITISDCHHKLSSTDENLNCIPSFNVNESKLLYDKLLDIVYNENNDLLNKKQYDILMRFNNDTEKYHSILELPKVIIHNDFNPRNIAIKMDETICIYDWELSVINLPHRDIVEFLAFTLPENFTKKTAIDYMKFHFKICLTSLDWKTWRKGYEFALKEFIITRVTFYCAANIVLKLKFHKRILMNSLKMLDYLEN